MPMAEASACISTFMAWLHGGLGAQLVVFIRSLEQHRAVEVTPAGDADRTADALSYALRTVHMLLAAFGDDAGAHASVEPLCSVLQAAATRILQALLGDAGWLTWAFEEAAGSAAEERADLMGLCCAVTSAVGSKLHSGSRHLSDEDSSSLLAAVEEAMAAAMSAPVVDAVCSHAQGLLQMKGEECAQRMAHLIDTLARMCKGGVKEQQLQLLQGCQGIGELLQHVLSRSAACDGGEAAWGALALLMRLWGDADLQAPLVFAECVLQPLCDIVLGRWVDVQGEAKMHGVEAAYC